MKNILLVGPGRLGCSLGVVLGSVSEFSLSGVVYHSEAGRNRAFRWMSGTPSFTFDGLVGVSDADIVLLAVRDDVISHVAQLLKPHLDHRHVVLHTSGLLDADALEEVRSTCAVGSFHPLQSFVDPTAARQRFEGCFVACEGDAKAVSSAMALANALGCQPIELAVGGKVAYHAAAVVAANYAVVLTDMAVQLAALAGITQDQAIAMLQPLQNGALQNLCEVGLPGALTGPIARGDAATVQAHLQVIQKSLPHLSSVYAELGRWAVQIARAQGQDPDRLAAILQILDGQPSG